MFFIISSVSSFSQQITLLDKSNNKPIKEAYIFSTSNPGGVISNKDGEFSLANFKKDEYVSVQHIHYEVFRFKPNELDGSVLYLIEKKNSLPTVYYNHPLRYNSDEDDEAGQIEKINREIVQIENPPTSADMLQNTGSILVQKSQAGGGSPIMRGFEANKLLLVVDGVRMNNAIYRSGHLQNSITIDNAVLQETEIIFGPSSALYGSDALGGVIHFKTINPEITLKDSLYFDGSSYLRYNTNNRSMAAHFDFSTGKNKWALLSSITANQFGDVIMGKNQVFDRDEGFGLHPDVVVQNLAGQDTMVTNLQPQIQANSGYSQVDILEKFVYQSNDHLKYTVNLQYSNSSTINRYDKLTEYSDDTLKFAEWYYGPQQRIFGQFKADFSKNPNNPNNKFYHQGVFSVAYQKIDEDRISRLYDSPFREHQNEDVNVFSLNLDFNRILPGNRILFYGMEAQHNYVKSTAFAEHIGGGSDANIQTRYPDLSNYLTSGIYLEYKQKFNNGLSLSTGIRYSFIYANSQFKDTSFLKLPFNQVNLITSAPSGNIGLVYRPDSSTILKSQLTTAFRAPNIDDYGKVFEKKGVTVVPNDQLKPEYAIGGELSAERSFANNFIQLGAVGYTTYLHNAMVQRDFNLNGQDSIFYNGEMTKIQAIVNTDNAIIYGTSANLKINFSKALNFEYTYTFTKGTDLSANTPLEHIPPQFGKIAFTYKNEKLNTSLFSFYNFRKNEADYTPGGDNIDLTPREEGTPPWWTLNYRISYTFYDRIMLQFAVDNILDVQYRQFSSGISAPGRNFMIGLKADF